MNVQLPTRLRIVLKNARMALHGDARLIPAARRSADPTTPTVPLPRGIAQILHRASSAVSRVRATEGLLTALIVLLSGLLATCFVDWLIRTPQPVRILLFLLQVLAVAIIVWVRVLRPLSRKPSDREAALLLQAKFPALRSAPISSIELACGHGRSFGGARELVERLANETAILLRGLDPGQVATPNSVKKLVKWTVALTILNSAWIALLWPGSLSWLARWPGFPVPPPTQTIVRSITTDLTAQRGGNVELRARADGVIPSSGRVRLEFAEGTKSEIPAQRASRDSNEFSAIVTSVQSPFHYVFTLNDGEGFDHRVKVVLPPAVAGFTIRETFPAYTKRKPVDHDTGNLEFLVGSLLEITVNATQALTGASCVLAGTSQTIPMDVSKSSPLTASLRVTVPAGLTGLSFPLVNADGVTSVDDTKFRASSTPDKPPDLALADNNDIESISSDAGINLAYTCTDDYGLSRIDLHYAITPTGTAETPDDSAFKTIPLPLPEKDRATFRWKPGSMPGASPGTTVRFYVEAADNREPDGPGLSRTGMRSLAIVTLAEKKLENLRRAMEAARQIRELGDKQQDVQEKLRGTKITP
jgi:hypothetical protein